MQVPILFDGWAEENSVEGPCTNLSRLAQSPGAFTPPPELFITGGVPRQGDRWVISDISWGNMAIWVLRNGKRFRVRQDANLTLLESIKPDLVKTRGDMPGTDRSRTKHKSNNSNPGYHLYTVKDGESLRSIAAREYGDAAQWKVIAEANGHRGSSVAAGSIIKIPETANSNQDRRF
jgi:hypothetical protein